MVTMSEAPTEVLQAAWEELMNDGTRDALARAQGMVAGFSRIGVITEAEAEGWLVRFRRCPEAPHDPNGPRAWCAYCGDIERPKLTPNEAERLTVEGCSVNGPMGHIAEYTDDNGNTRCRCGRNMGPAARYLGRDR